MTKRDHIIPTRHALTVTATFFLVAYPSAIALVVLICNLLFGAEGQSS